MPGRELTTLVDGGSFFESPRWHEGCWWVSDFLCAAPDFFEQALSQAREAVLLTTRVEVPHAGMP